MKSLTIIGTAVILAACSGQPKQKGNSIVSTEIKSTINLSTFKEVEFPDTIDGCACYFKEKGKESKGYIYVDDFSRSAFIKIGDTFEGLEIYESHDEDGIVYHKCRAEHYGVVLNLKEIDHEDETWEYEGTMDINKIDGSKTTLEIIGECGC